MNLWNVKNFPMPPINTYKSNVNDIDIKYLHRVFEEGRVFFKDDKYMYAEYAILSRIVYRMKQKFRSAKDFKALEKIEKALENYFNAGICSNIATFMELIPPNYKSDNDDTYLPTKNLLDYILVRLQGFAKLMERIVETSKIAAYLLEMRIRTGHFWKVAFICFGLVSRVYILAKYTATFICEFYRKLLPFSSKLKNTHQSFLPKNYTLPRDLKEWLKVDWLEFDDEVQIIEMPTDIPQIMQFFDLVDDDDVEISDEYVMIHEDDVEVVSEFRNLPNINSKNLRHEQYNVNELRGFSTNEYTDIIQIDTFEENLKTPNTKLRTNKMSLRGFENDDVGEVIEINDSLMTDHPSLMNIDDPSVQIISDTETDVIEIIDNSSDKSFSSGLPLETENIVSPIIGDICTNISDSFNEPIVFSEIDNNPKNRNKRITVISDIPLMNVKNNHKIIEPEQSKIETNNNSLLKYKRDKILQGTGDSQLIKMPKIRITKADSEKTKKGEDLNIKRKKKIKKVKANIEMPAEKALNNNDQAIISKRENKDISYNNSSYILIPDISITEVGRNKNSKKKRVTKLKIVPSCEMKPLNSLTKDGDSNNLHIDITNSPQKAKKKKKFQNRTINTLLTKESDSGTNKKLKKLGKSKTTGIEQPLMQSSENKKAYSKRVVEKDNVIDNTKKNKKNVQNRIINTLLTKESESGAKKKLKKLEKCKKTGIDQPLIQSRENQKAYSKMIVEKENNVIHNPKNSLDRRGIKRKKRSSSKELESHLSQIDRPNFSSDLQDTQWHKKKCKEREKVPNITSDKTVKTFSHNISPVTSKKAKEGQRLTKSNFNLENQWHISPAGHNSKNTNKIKNKTNTSNASQKIQINEDHSTSNFSNSCLHENTTVESRRISKKKNRNLTNQKDVLAKYNKLKKELHQVKNKMNKLWKRKEHETNESVLNLDKNNLSKISTKRKKKLKRLKLLQRVAVVKSDKNRLFKVNKVGNKKNEPSGSHKHKLKNKRKKGTGLR